MVNNKGFLLFPLLVCIAVQLSGCASPASKDALIVHDIAKVHPYKESVAVTVQGGSETGAMDSSNVSNSDLAQAIEESITENGLFAKIIHGNGSDYLLNVTIVNMSKPLFGADFTVSMETAWSLSEVRAKKVVMRESIKSSYTATMGESFVGVTRLRLALEGAVRENIRQGMLALSQLHRE